MNHKILYEIKRYQPVFKSDIINLLEYMWKGSENKRRKIFEWKYNKNPFLNEPYAYVALHDNKVIGFRGFFPTKFLFNNEVILMLSPSDTIVNPTHRRKGLFNKMTKYAIKEISKDAKINFFLNLSSNQYSTPGYLKLGWEQVYPEFPISTKTLTGLFLGKISGRNIYKKNKYFFNIADEILYRIWCKKLKIDGRFEISTKIYSNSMAALFANQEIGRLHHIKDSSYYNWRFKRPYINYIMSYLWRNDGNLSAYLIFIQKGEGHFMLVDYSYENPIALQTILSLFIKKTKANFVTTWGFAKSPNTKKTLKIAGFYSPKLLYKINSRYIPLPFLVRPIDIVLTKESWKVQGRDIRDVNIWDLNPIDSDGN